MGEAYQLYDHRGFVELGPPSRLTVRFALARRGDDATPRRFTGRASGAQH